MQITADTIAALEKFQRDPNLFFRTVLGAEPEEYQARLNQLIADNERVACSACHDVGKSWDLARIVLWFASCFPFSKVITTAPTYNQVKNILWSEIRSAHNRSKMPLGGKMNLTEWQLTPEGDWFAIGFTPRNEVSGEEGQGTASTFQGFHAPYIMLVFDEATGVPSNIWNMAEGILTSGHVKFVCIGNPTSRASEFFRCFTSPDWAKLKLSCFDSPNLKANGVTNVEELRKEIDLVRSLSEEDAAKRLKSYTVVKSYLLTLAWVVRMGLPRKWGIDHPLFVSKALGEFPAEGEHTLVPLGVVEDAQLRTYYPTASDRKSIGIDVARFGSDASVLTALHGKKQLGKKKFLKYGTTELVGEAIQFAKEIGGCDVFVVDGTGVGSGVVDVLQAELPNIEMFWKTEVREVQFGAGVECDGPQGCKHYEDCAKAKFLNLKARMFRLLADDMRSGDGLALIDEDVYREELPTIRFGYDSKGRMFIESKDEYSKRTGRKSPDDSDSLALANFGRYDEMGIGKFPDTTNSRNQGFARPFAASLTGGRQW